MSYINKGLMISFEEYSTALDKMRHRLPYTYSLENGRQQLFYFGSEHKRDPSHPQFEEMQNEWVKFLEKTQNKEHIVIHEGNVNENSLHTIKNAIEQFGESGAIVYLARRSSVPHFRPEPTIGYESKLLLKDYSREEVAYFYSMRAAASWRRVETPEGFYEFAKRIEQRNITELGWVDFDFSFGSAVVKMHTKLFDKEFDIEDKNFIMRIANPMYNLSVINDIARASSMIRNMFILDCIDNYWQKGFNIFVVYGASHAVMQEPALRDMIGRAK